MGGLFVRLAGKASGAVLGFAAPYLTYIVAGAFAFVIGFAGVLWLQKASADREVDRLQIEKDRLASEVQGLQFTVASKNLAIASLEGANKALAEHAREVSQIQRDINNAPATDDAPVAPVLDRALRAIGRLRQSSQPKN